MPAAAAPTLWLLPAWHMQLMTFEEHSKRVWSVDYSTIDPTRLVSGSDDGTIKVWSLNQESSVASINCKVWGPGAAVGLMPACATGVGGMQVALVAPCISAGRRACLAAAAALAAAHALVWPPLAPRLCARTPLAQANVCSVQFNPGLPHLIAAGTANCRAYLYDLRRPDAPLTTIQGGRA